MRTWDLTTHDVAPHQPDVLHSEEGAARAIAINLPAGERLQEHEVKERAFLFVASGSVELQAGADTVTAGPGTFAAFAPREQHEVVATSDARLLLLLAPWPAPDHGRVRSDAAAESRALR
jgi:quercetin dioxygenase-like cupin family protein